MKVMKMDGQSKQFIRSIDGWNRKRLLVLNAEDYKFRSRFSEFIDQMNNTRN